jgi:hypothetical protein
LDGVENEGYLYQQNHLQWYMIHFVPQQMLLKSAAASNIPHGHQSKKRQPAFMNKAEKEAWTTTGYVRLKFLRYLLVFYRAGMGSNNALHL